MSQESGDSKLSRRTALKGTAAGAIGATAIPSSVSASSDSEPTELRRKRLRAKKNVPQEYDSREIKKAFEKYAQSLLDELVERRILRSASLDEFSATLVADQTSAHAETTDDGKLAVEGTVNEKTGESIPAIETYARLGRAKAVGIVVFPETETAVAVVDSKDRDEEPLVLNDSGRDVTTAGSCTGDICQTRCDFLGGLVMRDGGNGSCGNQCPDYDPPCSVCSDQSKCSNW